VGWYGAGGAALRAGGALEPVLSPPGKLGAPVLTNLSPPYVPGMGGGVAGHSAEAAGAAAAAVGGGAPPALALRLRPVGGGAKVGAGASVIPSTKSFRLMLLIMEPHRLPVAAVLLVEPVLPSRLWVAPGGPAGPLGPRDLSIELEQTTIALAKLLAAHNQVAGNPYLPHRGDRGIRPGRARSSG
jgi:hypothetical protein